MASAFLYTLRRLVIACAVGAWAMAFPALGQGVDRDVLTRVVAGVPRDAELVVLVRDPVAMLTANEKAGPIAQGVQVGVVRGMAGSWKVLAKQLGMEPDAAMKRLGGGGVAFVSFPMGEEQAQAGAANDHWAVMGVVDAATAREVREHLKALPKAIVGGQAVLSVEDGKYALITRPLVPMDEKSVHVLAVAPWGQDVSALEKIAEAVGAVGGQGDDKGRMGGTRVWREAMEKGATDILVLARGGMLEFGGPPSKIPGEGHEWERNVVIRGTLQAAVWRMKYTRAPALADAAVARALPEGCGRVFERLSAGASVAVVDQDSSRLRQIPFGTILGAGALGNGDGPYALAVRARGVGEGMGGIAPEKGTSEVVVAGCYSGSVAAGKELDKRGAAIVAAVDDGAPKVDAGTLAWLPGGSQRVTTMSLTPGMPMMPIVGKEACAAWWMFQEPGRGEAWDVWMFVPGMGAEAAGARRGAVEEMLTVGTPPAAGKDEKLWLTRAVLRPRMFIEALHPLMAVSLSAFAVCEEVKYEAWVGEGGRLEAVMEVRWGEGKK